MTSVDWTKTLMDFACAHGATMFLCYGRPTQSHQAKAMEHLELFNAAQLIAALGAAALRPAMAQ